ncbi:unnamed protein product [Paramecium sonneborni]|uniref:Uncharacterized protein n=1 Tax=Paramecium sonneborni TaxID=65129 RepID=A0A8S1MV41_9CILI|nr:unnamed protein product [Paramecium sonneborni]
MGQSNPFLDVLLMINNHVQLMKIVFAERCVHKILDESNLKLQVMNFIEIPIQNYVNKELKLFLTLVQTQIQDILYY